MALRVGVTTCRGRMDSSAADLSEEALAAALPGREIHFYPTVVSTEADAMARSRAGAPEGTLVVADYQISARSRPGRRWRNSPGSSLSCSLVMRPRMPPLRGGILYLVATAAVADVAGAAATIEWPDEVYVAGELAGVIGVHLEVSVKGLEWAVISAMLPRADPPRPALVARLVNAIEARYRLPPDELVAGWLPRCRTIGRAASAVLYPIGAGRKAAGRAIGVRPNGALILETGEGKDQALPPYELSSLEFSD